MPYYLPDILAMSNDELRRTIADTQQKITEMEQARSKEMDYARHIREIQGDLRSGRLSEFVQGQKEKELEYCTKRLEEIRNQCREEYGASRSALSSKIDDYRQDVAKLEADLERREKGTGDQSDGGHGGNSASDRSLENDGMSYGEYLARIEAQNRGNQERDKGRER